MNKCQRCNRPLITPNATYGWRCAQILGINPLDPRVTGVMLQKIDTGVKKAESMIKNSPIQMTEKDKGDFYASFAKQSLWDGIDDFKVKEARKEGYSALNASKAKRTNIQKELEEYAKLHKDKNEEIKPDPNKKKYKEYIDAFGLLNGTSQKLAEMGSLDEVTNAVLKVHDDVAGNTISRKLGNPVTSKLYDSAHNVLAGINYNYNKKIDLSSYKGGFINDQNNGVVSKLKLGVDKMKDNGCEVIAAYNALIMLDNPKDIRDVAYYFENDGQMLGGKFGTNPYAIKRYFERGGYKVKTLEGEDITDKNIPDADTYILSVWNTPNVTDALHTVALRKTKDGFELFNYRYDDVFPADSLQKEMKKAKEIPLILHCISKE